MSAFGIQITDNQSAPQAWTIGPRVLDWQHTTAIPGGCLSASFRIYAPTFIPPIFLRMFYNLEASDERGVFWSGRIEDLSSGQDQGGEYWDVGCVGWGVHLDDQIDPSEDPSSTESSTIVTNAITNFAPKIDVQTVTASGYTLAAGATALKMMTPAMILAWVMKFGNSANNAQQWHVYPQADGDLEFTFENRPTASGYFARIERFVSKRFGANGQRLANRVIVSYSNATASVTVNNTTLQGAGPDGWGFIKAAALIYPELTSGTDATQIATTAAALAGVTRMAARALTANNDVVFHDANLQAVPLHRIRSGKILEFVDLVGQSVGGSNSLTYERSCLIAGTSYSEDAKSLAITPENYDLTLEQQIAKIYQVLGGAHTTRGSL